MTHPLSDVVLAHYGVKGMKWGKRKANPVRDARRERNEATVRIANKMGADKKAEAIRRDKSIEDARASIAKSKANISAAKKQYKTDRKEVGRQAAKAALIRAKNQELETLMTKSSTAMLKTTREQQQENIEKMSGILLSAILKSK